MVEIRGVARDEVAEFRQAISYGFGGDLPASERTSEADELYLASRGRDDLIAAFDGGRVVATFGCCRFELTVPGGLVPMAGATAVTVQPTHRRRGILSEMMGRHLTAMAQQGQVVGGLWASDEAIYGRFGYGHAVPAVAISGPWGGLNGPPPPPDLGVRTVVGHEAARLLADVYDSYRQRVPGAISRSSAWWHDRHIGDQEFRRHGASSLRIVVAERPAGAAGYVAYRQRAAHGPTMLSTGTVEIQELVALDDDARRALWRFVGGIDLFPNLSWPNCPIDEPILIEMDRVRRLDVTVRQGLWLRLLDVPAAFERRRYEQNGAIVLGISDGLGLADGTFRLGVEGGAGSCERVAGPADVQMGAAAAAALYLGGVSALTLARAGQISGPEEAVRRLDALVTTASAPHAIEQF